MWLDNTLLLLGLLSIMIAITGLFSRGTTLNRPSSSNVLSNHINKGVDVFCISAGLLMIASVLSETVPNNWRAVFPPFCSATKVGYGRMSFVTTVEKRNG